MRHLLLSSLAALAWLGVFGLQQTFAAPDPDQSDKPNFSGIWTLDLRASMSLDPLMTQIGATFFDRKYAAWTKLKATLEQTDGILRVATRGPGFALDQTLYLDGRSDSSDLELLGATSVNPKTTWSRDYKQLLETNHIRTKQGQDGQLTIKRYLMDDGQTLTVAYTLKLTTEPDEISARQIWHKQA